MTRREKVLSVTALLMIWFGAGYRFWFQPLALQIQAVEQQIAAAESEAQPADMKSSLLEGQLTELEGKSRFLAYEAKQKEQEKQIPKRRALPELLEQLVAWASETGVRLAEFRVEPENTRNAENKDASFRVIRVHTQIEGSYAQVIAFLIKLEQSERLIRVDQLEISLNERAKPGRSESPGPAFPGSEGTFNLNLQARIRFSIYYRPN